MDHHSAIDSQAAERYTLAEMNQAERADFEMHYFDCTVCTADVLAYEKLRMAVRDWNPKPVPVPVPVPPDLLRRIAPWAIAASIAGWGCVGIDHVVTLPQYAAQVHYLNNLVDQFRGVPEQIEMTPGTRSAAMPPNVKSGRPLLLNVEILPHEDYVSYRGVLYGPGNAMIQTTPIAVDTTVPVVVRPLPAGSYKMVIEGVRKDGNRPKITATYPFVVSGS
ncbi:MAG: hypothetical protein QOH21_2991 [Acidobacteriota bacterium]|jgi:hypothetical protein|nr:hypothetical protein [Acidobacteriota bacterium]